MLKLTQVFNLENPLAGSRCHESDDLKALRTEMEESELKHKDETENYKKEIADLKKAISSEQNKINQLGLQHKDETEKNKTEIAQLKEIIVQQRKREEALPKRKTEIEKINLPTENTENESIDKLMKENSGLKLDLASKDKEYVKVKIELESLLQKRVRDLNDIQRLCTEVEQWKSKAKMFMEAMTSNRGRKCH